MISMSTRSKGSRVCFVSLNSSHLLFHENSDFMGGAELQQVLIGSELSRRGRRVSFVTRVPEAPQATPPENIRVLTTFRQSAGVPILRFVYPRAYTIIKALLSADADIYYVRGSSFILALVVLVARLRGRSVVFCGAYDLDFDPERLRLPNFRDRWLYFWGLKRVDAVIAQNEAQQRMARDNFSLDARKIHNCYPAAVNRSALLPEALWVGNFRDTKNPETYLTLARDIPEIQFVMIGGKPGQRDFLQIEQAAKAIPNLNFLGFQPLEETEKYFDRVRVLVNTSEYEGFPNTFLQAWSRGIPVVSFIDPDGLVSRNQLGWVVKNLSEMTACIRAIMNNELGFDSEQIRNYFAENHLVEKVTAAYEAFFDSLGDRT